MAFCSSYVILASTSSLLLVISQMIGSTKTAAMAASALPEFDSIYQFGDSVSDTGNFAFETDVSPCNLKPFGETHFGKPTGRCSDGLLLVDYLAQAFNLPLLNPDLQRDANFSNGANFAVAGATALDASRYPAATTNSSLSVQIRRFKDHLDSLCSSSLAGDCKKKLERSLFVLGEIGANDYNLLVLAGESSPQDLQSTVHEVIKSIAAAVKELIDHGATYVVVPGNFPFGCLPLNHDASASSNTALRDDFGCIKDKDEFASYHNHHLQQALQHLQKHNPSVSIYYGDFYAAYKWILANAASLGFEKDKVFEACCGNVTHPCATRVANACSNPEKMIIWDGSHLTHRGYKYLTQWLLSDLFPSKFKLHHRHLAQERSSPTDFYGNQLIPHFLGHLNGCMCAKEAN